MWKKPSKRSLISNGKALLGLGMKAWKHRDEIKKAYKLALTLIMIFVKPVGSAVHIRAFGGRRHCWMHNLSR